MEVRDIEYFAVVAEHGHVGRAAEALGLSQPAISMSLRRLEKSLQAKLVKRTPRGIELTAVGSALLAQVRRLRLTLNDITREATDLSQGRAGHLRIGAASGAAEELLPAALSALLEDAPKVKFTVTVAPTVEMLQVVRKGELDLIVSGIPNSRDVDLVHEHLLYDEFVVFASVHHRLAKRKMITMEDVAQERWALPVTNVWLWQGVQRAFEESGLPPPMVTMEATSASLRLRTVASSALLGLTSRQVVQQAQHRFRVTELRIKELTWSRSVGVSYRTDAYLSPAARRFIEILKATTKKIAKEQS